MKWEGREESENVEDRRGISVTKGAAIGAGGIVVVLLALLLGGDPKQLLQKLASPQQNAPAARRATDPEEERMAKFTKVILRDTERVWQEQFAKLGREYHMPKLVLFRGEVDSACGRATSAVGPFYCSGDSRLYIDLSFYRDLERKLNAPGEFARAYVIAHEVGHHVQHLLGYSRRVHAQRGKVSPAEYNRLSVRLELQADYLAGVWAHHADKQFNYLETGDLESALKAAIEIGDDRLQLKRQGYVNRDHFTHGTSEQRKRWFKKGFDSGDVKGADALFKLRYEDL